VIDTYTNKGDDDGNGGQVTREACGWKNDASLVQANLGLPDTGDFELCKTQMLAGLQVPPPQEGVDMVADRLINVNNPDVVGDAYFPGGTRDGPEMGFTFKNPLVVKLWLNWVLEQSKLNMCEYVKRLIVLKSSDDLKKGLFSGTPEFNFLPPDAAGIDEDASAWRGKTPHEEVNVFGSKGFYLPNEAISDAIPESLKARSYDTASAAGGALPMNPVELNPIFRNAADAGENIFKNNVFSALSLIIARGIIINRTGIGWAAGKLVSITNSAFLHISPSQQVINKLSLPFVKLKAVVNKIVKKAKAKAGSVVKKLKKGKKKKKGSTGGGLLMNNINSKRIIRTRKKLNNKKNNRRKKTIKKTFKKTKYIKQYGGNGTGGLEFLKSFASGKVSEDEAERLFKVAKTATEKEDKVAAEEAAIIYKEHAEALAAAAGRDLANFNTTLNTAIESWKDHPLSEDDKLNPIFNKDSMESIIQNLSEFNDSQFLEIAATHDGAIKIVEVSKKISNIFYNIDDPDFDINDLKLFIKDGFSVAINRVAEQQPVDNEVWVETESDINHNEEFPPPQGGQTPQAAKVARLGVELQIDAVLNPEDLSDQLDSLVLCSPAGALYRLYMALDGASEGLRETALSLLDPTIDLSELGQKGVKKGDFSTGNFSSSKLYNILHLKAVDEVSNKISFVDPDNIMRAITSVLFFRYQENATKFNYSFPPGVLSESTEVDGQGNPIVRFEAPVPHQDTEAKAVVVKEEGEEADLAEVAFPPQ
jgi:hypothetical protein